MNWNTLEDANRYYRLEGFWVGESVCIACHHIQPTAIEPTTNIVGLECHNCHKFEAVFIPEELPSC